MRIAKFLVALAVAALTALVSKWSDGVVTPEEWIQVAIAGATAAGVFFTPNVPHAPVAKMIVAAVLAVLNLAATYITGGIHGYEAVNLVLAALGVFGVWAVPNGGVTPARAVR